MGVGLGNVPCEVAKQHYVMAGIGSTDLERSVIDQ
jgi:hypothetical protein